MRIVYAALIIAGSFIVMTSFALMLHWAKDTGQHWIIWTTLVVLAFVSGRLWNYR